MSGAGAAMRRVFVDGERAALDEPRVAELAGLAARIRELTEAVVHTDVDAAEVAAVSEEIAALTRRLSAARRSAPPIAAPVPGAPQIGRQLANPVTGPLNPIAPPVTIETRPDRTVFCDFTLTSVYEGPPGFVHGGVSAMVLDQLLGAAAHAAGAPGMTAALDLRYRRPTPYGVPLRGEAEVTGVVGRRTHTAARIIAPDGTVTVEATAVFVLPRGLSPEVLQAAE
ncbi:PaaI family thioesterase [Actinomadura sp. NPDC047616]|uniref:PaaI family thioesterase n=1 Tax=Actinomadura sp. NPDC047616 TaxID=3155914 RepID=UPI0033C044B4